MFNNARKKRFFKSATKQTVSRYKVKKDKSSQQNKSQKPFYAEDPYSITKFSNPMFYI